MYADFESILEPIQGPNPVPTGPYTLEVTKHSPSGWCVYSKFGYGEVKDPLKLYRGKDCLEKFCDYIRQEAHRLYHMFPEKPIDPLTKSNGRNTIRRAGVIFALNNLVTPKRDLKYVIIAIVTGCYRVQHIGIAI